MATVPVRLIICLNFLKCSLKSFIRLWELGRLDPEPPEKVAAPQHCFYHEISHMLEENVKNH